MCEHVYSLPPALSRPWEEDLISFHGFTSLFAFMCPFQCGDPLYTGSGKIEFRLGASCTLSSGGGMCTGSSHGAVNVLWLSPPAFLTVTCSCSYTIKPHLSAPRLLWAGLISLVCPQFTHCSGIFKLKGAFCVVNYFTIMFLFIFYHKTFSFK